MEALLKVKGKKGFTLVEVLIVVVVLGILGAVIMPKLLTNPERGRRAEAVAMLGTMMRLEEQYKNDSPTGAFLALTSPGVAADWQKIGFDTATDSTPFTGKYWDFTFEISDSDMVLTCTVSPVAIATRRPVARPSDVPADAKLKLCADRYWTGNYTTVSSGTYKPGD